jgi:hypothetical protein
MAKPATKNTLAKELQWACRSFYLWFRTKMRPRIPNNEKVFLGCIQALIRGYVFKYRFNIDDDIYFITDENTAAIHCILPTDSKILTIDPRGS